MVNIWPDVLEVPLFRLGCFVFHCVFSPEESLGVDFLDRRHFENDLLCVKGYFNPEKYTI